jgi:hypothetical protein
MLSYKEVLPQLVIIINHKASVVIAPFELAFIFQLANLAPPGPPLPCVVVQRKSVRRDPSEVKNIIGNLLHLALVEAMRQVYPVIHELN